MAWKNGVWEPEDDSVSSRVTALTKQDSPIMLQASGLGAKVANRRGLVNSSMAAGEAQKATLAAAVPIASQDAQQVYGKNVQHQQGQITEKINTQNLAAAQQERIAAALTAASGNYSQSISGMLGNEKISAADRGRFMTSAQDAMLANIAALERIYGVQLNWGAAPSGSPAPAPNPAPAPGRPGSAPPISGPGAGLVRRVF